MKRFFYTILLILSISALGPLLVLWQGEVDFSTSNWRDAKNDSAQIAPDPKQHPEALVQVYAARVFNWRGLFAVHTWIAVKPQDAAHYTRYEVINWRRYEGLPLVAIEQDLPDRHWFGNKPELLLSLAGAEAQEMIAQIDSAARAYEYQHTYHYWPGPNSNTFIADMARQVPAMKLVLPGNAVGKDYLALKEFWARAPSGTGYQLSLGGVVSIMLAYEEGLEINFLGLVYGISPATRTLKFPGIGDIRF